MSHSLSSQELCQLVQRVFVPGPADRALAIMTDLPDSALPDHPAWQSRRTLAATWHRLLEERKGSLGLERVSLAWYRNSGSNNADLPPTFRYGGGGDVPASVDELADRAEVPFAELFRSHSLIIAPTELSATAPLKVAAKDHPIRAATMPGFIPEMIPALRIDYGEVNRRVQLLKGLLDPAETADIVLRSDGGLHHLRLDLRHRTAHASGGLFPENGVAGNLPSGEAYIVPYEGERPDQPSLSIGELPVQIDAEIVLYRIERNRAIEVTTSGPRSEQERARISNEPAYANLAELGLGVLGDFGLKPTGSILLDEKLGLHIAFGRSDHFGGAVGPSDFTSPAAVIHLDRVYIPESQPRIAVESVRLLGPTLDRRIMAEGTYLDVF